MAAPSPASPASPAALAMAPAAAAAEAAPALFEPPAASRVRLLALRYCTAPDLGQCLAASRAWRADADTEHTWLACYEHTQRAEPGTTGAHGAEGPSLGAPLRNLVGRPFGEAAVGWRVEVLQLGEDEEPTGFAKGRVTDYNPHLDLYCVAYHSADAEEENVVWEVEHLRDTAMTRRNPSFAGRSRFVFLAPPGDVWDGRPRPRSGPPLNNSLVRFGSWKQELRHNVRNAPLRQLHRLSDHRDEVLFVSFSPCGRRLASCSRDCRTFVYQVRGGAPGCQPPSFELEAELQHQTAACRAVWWPLAPHQAILVMTEDTSYQGFHGASSIEVWELRRLSGDSAPTAAGERDPRQGARRLCLERTQPFDIHTAILPWPPWEHESGVTPDPASLAFLSGQAVVHEPLRCVQWLSVWPGPAHPRFSDEAWDDAPRCPLAMLRLQCTVNYMHALQASPELHGSKVLALTGSTPHLCDELAILDLRRAELRDPLHRTGRGLTQLFDVPARATSMGDRHVLGAKWAHDGALIVLNARPYVKPARPRLAQLSQPPTLDELARRPAPDLSTSIELLLLDAGTLECVGTFDGHFAFTTKECPFTILPDDWSDAEFLASGGEDGGVYVWHRRHGRLIRRLRGHRAPVNAVSWNEAAGLLASASDDQTVIVWTSGRDW